MTLASSRPRLARLFVVSALALPLAATAQKPAAVSGSSWKLAPMVFSGTTMIACLSPCLCSLSSAMNISARLLPEAGGDLRSRYCSPRRW